MGDSRATVVSPVVTRRREPPSLFDPVGSPALGRPPQSNGTPTGRQGGYTPTSTANLGRVDDLSHALALATEILAESRRMLVELRSRHFIDDQESDE